MAPEKKMIRKLRWIYLAVLAVLAVYTALDFELNAGDTNNPDAQLASMLPGEREFCEQTLWQINSKSTQEEVIALLGQPYRNRIIKLNWWVELDGKKDRIGVYFDTAGLATEVVLDGGWGRFYYKRDVKDHEQNTPSNPPQKSNVTRNTIDVATE